MELKPLKCPSCNASLNIPEEANQVTCDYCGVTSQVSRDGDQFNLKKIGEFSTVAYHKTKSVVVTVNGEDINLAVDPAATKKGSKLIGCILAFAVILFLGGMGFSLIASLLPTLIMGYALSPQMTGITERAIVELQKEATMPTAAQLPASLHSENGWDLQVLTVEVFSSLPFETAGAASRPEKNVYVLVFGKLTNRTFWDACLENDSVAIADAGGRHYGLSSSAITAFQPYLGLEAPDAVKGLCLADGDSVSTYFVFDVPKESSLTLLFQDATLNLGAVGQYELMETP